MRYAYLLPLVLLAACTRDGGPIGEHHYPPTPENYQVPVYITKQPTRPYEEVGYFRRESGRDDPTWAVNRARTVGGDAVILHTNAGSYEEGSWLKSSSGGTLCEAIAIRWTDIPASQQ